jgi:hypothetical protein
MGIFSKLVVTPIEISDISTLPAGPHNVRVLDLLEMKQSQGITIVKGKLVLDPVPRVGFNKAFDQEIMTVLLEEIGGKRYIIDRFSSKGWLESTDVDENGDTIMNAKKCKEFGLTPTDEGRYIDEDGVGVENPHKTETCLALVNRFGFTCGVEYPTLAIDSTCKIKVVDSKPYFSKKLNKMVTNQEVKNYYLVDETLADEPVVPIAQVVPESKPKKGLFGK